MSDICVVCDERVAVHTHHRKMRSQGGGDEPSNLLRVCLECHAWIHANPSDAYARGLLVHSWADPANVRLFMASEAEQMEDHSWHYAEEKATPLIIAPAPQEGEECGLCKRRVPHKKKESTPKSKVWSTRVPLDEQAESFSELVDAAAEHHGLTERPYHRYLCLLFGVTLLLQAQKGDLPVG